MSLRRELRRLMRAATKALKVFAKVYAKRAEVPGLGQSGLPMAGADALEKALDGFRKDPVLEQLDTTPPRSFARIMDEPDPAKKAEPPPEPG